MAERIDDPAELPPMFSTHRGLLDGARRECPRLDRRGVADQEQNSRASGAELSRHYSLGAVSRRRNPEDSVIDGQLRHEILALTNLMKHPCAEGPLIERDGGEAVVDP